MSHTLTTEELLLLQDMCLDGEFRCHQRAMQAQVRGDYQAAAYEMQVKEQYSNLKQKLLAALDSHGNHDLARTLEQLRSMRHPPELKTAGDMSNPDSVANDDSRSR